MIFSSSIKCWFEEKLILINSISIYIQEIINKMNIWYLIIKIIKKKIIYYINQDLLWILGKYEDNWLIKNYYKKNFDFSIMNFIYNDYEFYINYNKSIF